MQQLADRIIDNVEQVIYGKREVIQQAVVALFAGGHVLLEDVPGVGKTMLAKALAKSLGGTSKRIQFTPDLLPGDITGVVLYEQHNGRFRFRPGPVFSNVVLADEINRASPKTQAALLECMEEETVTVEGEVHRIGRPFIVLATQNPLEHEGVYPLPDSQLDRFMLRLHIGYPGRDQARELLRREATTDVVEELAAVTDPATVVECQRAVAATHCEDRLMDYVLDLVEASRHDEHLRLGASPRAALALVTAARALALITGRDYVRPDDVQALAVPVLAHRLLLEPAKRAGGMTGAEVVRELLARVPAP